jgi:hypothetical protein
MTKTSSHLSTAGSITFRDMHEGEQKTVKSVHELRDASIAIGSAAPCGAIVVAREDGTSFGASSNVDENAALIALNMAREAGYTNNVTLAISIQDNTARNPLSEDVLQALSEFGPATVLLVGDDRSVVIATLTD